MRPFALTLALLSGSAAAQAPAAPTDSSSHDPPAAAAESRPYADVGLGLGYARALAEARLDASLGIERASGLRYGVVGGAQSWRGGGSSVTAGYLGPAVGAEVPLGGGLSLDLASSAVLSGQRFRTDRPGARGTVGYLGGLADASAALQADVPLVGSVRIKPSAGLYARMGHWQTRVDNDGVRESGQGTLGDGGLQLALPISFRLGGLDMDLKVGGRVPIYGFSPTLLGPTPDAASLRVRF